MFIEYEKDNQTYNLNPDEQKKVVKYLVDCFKKFGNNAEKLKSRIDIVNKFIYQDPETEMTFGNYGKLSDITELYDTLSAHLKKNIFQDLDAIVNPVGEDEQSQENEFMQKQNILNELKQMKFSKDIKDKIIDSCIIAGECTLFVDWKKETELVRRYDPIVQDIIIEENVKYDGVMVDVIDPASFVIDNTEKNKDKALKAFVTMNTIDDIKDNKNYTLDEEALRYLEDEFSKNFGKYNTDNSSERVKVTTFYGDIKLYNGILLRNYCCVILDEKYIIRFEPNPYVMNPIIHDTIWEHANDSRGFSWLLPPIINVVKASHIVNKIVSGLDFIQEPAYWVPKGGIKLDKKIKPSDLVEIECSGKPFRDLIPVPIANEGSQAGQDLVLYFTGKAEGSCGIYKYMQGQQDVTDETATKTSQQVAGQSIRLEEKQDLIICKIVIPMIEAIAKLVSFFRFDDMNVDEDGNKQYQEVMVADKEGIKKPDIIDDSVRQGRYNYHYEDLKNSMNKRSESERFIQGCMNFAKVAKVNTEELFRYYLSNYHDIKDVEKYLMEDKLSQLLSEIPTEYEQQARDMLADLAIEVLPQVLQQQTMEQQSLMPPIEQAGGQQLG